MAREVRIYLPALATRRGAALVIVALVAASCVAAPPPAKGNAEPNPSSSVSGIGADAVATDAATPSAPSASDTNIVAAPNRGVDAGGAIVALPPEPWYRDKPEHSEDCVPPLATVLARHFPAPFDTCDPRAESYSSPPKGGELHFHYRFFSVALTRQQRAASPDVCCYMVWEFPRHN
jgi:hypothetical protein